MEIILGKTLSELQEVALSVGLPKFAGKQLAEWLYVRRARSFDEMTNISLKGREALKARYSVGRYAPVREAVSIDATRKYLFQISNLQSPISNDERQFIESVYIPEEDRATLCVSTQVGCKMGCRFCMTGTLGFHGQLSAADILNQLFEIDDIQTTNDQRPTTNLVLMGEGEPMDNLDNVLRALEILTADYGCAWSPKRITVSSVGVLPALQRFIEQSDCHLAISLHNPFADEREAIMPAQKAWPVEDVINLLKQYDWSHQRRVSFEYICFDGQMVNGQPVHNISPRHAKQLIRLLHDLPCRINLIRFHENPTINDQSLTTNDHRLTTITWFRDYLTDHGLTTTIRKSRGEDILAACGMLVNALQNEK